MSAVLFIPLSYGGVLVHVLNDIAPADSRVVCAEGNLAFLRPVGNDAHFRAAEIIIEQVLEPHSCYEQEVPAISSASIDVHLSPIATDLAVVFAGQAKRLIKLLEELVKRKLRRRIVRVIVLQERQTHHDV